MDVQVPQIMPLAQPAPNSATNYNYWNNYLASNNSSIGYRSYVHFMMYNGRYNKPDSANYVPLSPLSRRSDAGSKLAVRGSSARCCVHGPGLDRGSPERRIK